MRTYQVTVNVIVEDDSMVEAKYAALSYFHSMTHISDEEIKELGE